MTSSRAEDDGAIVRREVLMRGVVQGVGFRPHVARVAGRHRVTGFVGNDDRQVFIACQGTPFELDAFTDDVLSTLPPLAHVVSTTSFERPVVAGEQGFRIVASRHQAGVRTLIPPDVATCPDCLADMADPTNRRFGYAFTTCTNCGPRLSIITDLPYDRPSTTMAGFPLCPACATEYADPTNRRFHAQPISCFDCGPTLQLVPAGGMPVAPSGERRTAQDAALADARARLADGQILAVEGLGGFHLMCDARDEDAVARLRERKRRSGKPFAVMVGSVEEARRLADLEADQLGLLAAPARPIVIAPMASGYDLAPSIAPGLRDIGLLLPYTPIHTLLLAPGQALVATSGNLSEEPLCFTVDDALVRLRDIADAFLVHDRPIHVPVEDSVVLGGQGLTIPSRRSRGYAPLPLPLDADGPVILGVGGELKNTFCLANGDMAFVSAHLGDMGSWASQRAYEASVEQMLAMHRVRPDLVVCDLHPDYATTGWAERYADRTGVRVEPVQHHHAHALSLLTEHRVRTPAVVATLDGTGYGTDATIWGGEILAVGRDTACDRAWHLPKFPLVGGDRAVRHPWRIAIGLASAWGLDISETRAWLDAPTDERELVASQLASGVGVVQTSSLGRLFDAASALLGITTAASYEAEAAMRLEREATAWASEHAADAARIRAAARDALDRESPAPERTPRDLMVNLLVPDEMGRRAYAFHVGLARIVADQLIAAARVHDTEIVGVTGGCAMNRLFMTSLLPCLKDADLRILLHHVVPPNDGGLSLGQAAFGRRLLRDEGR